MSAKSHRLLAYFLFALGGSSIGFLVGGYSGSQFGMGVILNSTLSKDGLEIQRQLSALRELRAGDIDAAVARLEDGIEDTLVIFDPAEPYPGLRDDTIATVENAIRAAWEYRREFDPPVRREQVNTMVEALFRNHGLTP
ncbi:MAG: hypothetical protein QNJ85_09230 [Gammaproteobacteria bacterium]|nr:hypothetical protein [Gammaproteobacteria bacterium]